MAEKGGFCFWVGAGGGGGGGGRGGGRPLLGGGGGPTRLPISRDESLSDGVILVVDEEMLLVAREGTHGQQELGQVVAVQRAGLCRQPTWQVCVPHTYHSLQCAPGNALEKILTVFACNQL